MKVMIAVDQSNCSRRAVEWVAKSAWPVGTTFTVLGVVDTKPPLMEVSQTVESPANATKREIVQIAVDSDCASLQIALGNYSIDSMLTSGPASIAIVNTARQANAELIVVGSLSNDDFDRVLHASGSETILPGAPCPVVVVKEKKIAGGTGTGTHKIVQAISAAG